MTRSAPESGSGPLAVLSRADPASSGIVGADIAFALQSAGVPVVTPVPSPDPRQPDDWVFPDTASALRAGAQVLWAGPASAHDVRITERPVRRVGHDAAQVDWWDDKWRCNEWLREHGLPVARSILVGREGTNGVLPLGDVKPGLLAALGLETPLVIKPVRGRDGAGVQRVDSVPKLVLEVIRLIEATVTIDGKTQPQFGSRVMVEEHLPGDELAITVMPPGCYDISGVSVVHNDSWCLPPVRADRTVLDAGEQRAPEIASLLAACAAAGDLTAMRAPIRIDCRQRAGGAWQLFDLNMTPDLAGPGRPGRDDAASLTTLAAGAIGWSYGELLRQVLLLAR
jgi:D-alanine-D-alanine ligase